MNTLTIEQALALCSIMNNSKNTPCASTAPCTGVGRKVIVRSSDAGVLYGEYVSNDGPTITLKNARQLWKWQTAKGISLIDLATYGVNASGCKFSSAQAVVTVFNACALIDVTDDAAKSIERV